MQKSKSVLLKKLSYWISDKSLRLYKRNKRNNMKNYKTNQYLKINILLDNFYVLIFQHIFFA